MIAPGVPSVLICFQHLCFPPSERKRFYQNVSISQGEGELGFWGTQGPGSSARGYHHEAAARLQPWFMQSRAFVTSLLRPFLVSSKTTRRESLQGR